MKFLIASVATLLTAQAVHLNREPISVSAAQANLQPYSTLEVMDTQREVRNAQREIGAAEVAAAAQEEKVKAQKEQFYRHLEEGRNQPHEFDKPFVDKEGREFYPVHTQAPHNFQIESSTFDVQQEDQY